MPVVVEEAAEVAEVVEVKEKEERAEKAGKRKRRRSSAEHGVQRLLCIHLAVYGPNGSRKLLCFSMYPVPDQRSSAKSCGVLLLEVRRL